MQQTPRVYVFKYSILLNQRLEFFREVGQPVVENDVKFDVRKLSASNVRVIDLLLCAQLRLAMDKLEDVIERPKIWSQVLFVPAIQHSESLS